MANVTEKIRGMGIEDRIRKNWIVPLAVFRLLEPHLDLPHGQSPERCHFFIRTQTQFKGIGYEHVRQFVEPKRVLYLNFRAVRLLLENRINRTKGGNTLSIETLET